MRLATPNEDMKIIMMPMAATGQEALGIDGHGYAAGLSER